MSLIRVSVAHVGLLFLLACSSCSGSASADVPRTITAYVKETTLLPCSITHEDDLPTMEWSKEGITPNITFLYRDGCETFAEKNPDFLHRTNLVLDNLKDGNLSQIIYNLRLSDGGRYQCRTLRGRRWQVEATVDLVVVAVSEPKLTVVPSAGDGVLLQCKAECWSSEPTVMFLDDQGNEIKAKDPKRDEALARCFTVTRRATLQAGTNRVICRAKHMNKTRDTEMYIPDNWMSSCSYIIAIVVTIGATFLFTCGLCLCRDRLCRKHGDIAWRQKTLPSEPLVNQDERVRHLQTENEKLKATLSQKEQRIYSLTAELNELKSKHNPAPERGQSTHGSRSTPNGSKQGNQLPQFNNQKPATSSTRDHPEPDNKSQMKESKPAIPKQNLAPVPQIKRERPRSISEPMTNHGAASSSFPPTPKSGAINIPRSVSFSGPYPNSARSPRRYTSTNRFSVLENLSEDTESLLMSD